MCILSRRLWLMSLPASLKTDCGGLLNRRGPGRKCCCHTGLFTRDIMFTLHTDCSCPELSNYRIGLFSHGASRRVTVLLSRDLSFGPTDQREVICKLSNFFSHGESRRFSLSRDMFFVTNLRIGLFTRNVTDGRGGYEGGTIEA